MATVCSFHGRARYHSLFSPRPPSLPTDPVIYVRTPSESSPRKHFIANLHYMFCFMIMVVQISVAAAAAVAVIIIVPSLGDCPRPIH